MPAVVNCVPGFSEPIIKPHLTPLIEHQPVCVIDSKIQKSNNNLAHHVSVLNIKHSFRHLHSRNCQLFWFYLVNYLLTFLTVTIT